MAFVRLPAIRPRRLFVALACAVALWWFVAYRPAVLGGSTSFVVVSGNSMAPNFRSGDLVLVRRQAGYAAGDVVAFAVPPGEPAAGTSVIHRVVGGSGHGFVTQGDNVETVDPWHPATSSISGVAVLRLPLVGRLVRPDVVLPLFGALGAVFALVLLRRSPLAAPCGPVCLGPTPPLEVPS